MTPPGPAAGPTPPRGPGTSVPRRPATRARTTGSMRSETLDRRPRAAAGSCWPSSSRRPSRACGDDGTAAPPSPSRDPHRDASPRSRARPRSRPARRPSTTSPSPHRDRDQRPRPTATSSRPTARPGRRCSSSTPACGAHEGYDRVVWELAGDGTPGYRVGWTDDPRRDGSGEPVDLPGRRDAAGGPRRRRHPAATPRPAPTPTTGPRRSTAPAPHVVTEVEVGHGVRGLPHRLRRGRAGSGRSRSRCCSDPTRVVVDVSH